MDVDGSSEAEVIQFTLSAAIYIPYAVIDI